ncbi:MAG: DUF4124 domain-containing protein [Gammaproteobacteria bacterium]
MRARSRSLLQFVSPLFLCASMVQAQEFWRGVDADGFTVYSDRALPDARAISKPERPPNFSTVPQFRAAEPARVAEKLEKPSSAIAELGAESTTAIEIKNPQDQATIRNNAGEIAVNVAFSAQIADKILRLQLWMDDRLALEAAPDQRSFLLRDVPRGTHQLEVRVLHQEGTWWRSPTHTVYLHRASRLH